MNSSRYRRERSSAFTLMEVVVGLAIMAGVMVSSLLAFGAHQRARRTAESKLTAVRVADELLSQLSAGRGGVPASDRGLIAGQPGWWWQTEWIGTAAPAGIPVGVIAFRILEVSPDGSPRTLARVDIVKGTK
ncbi:hypothetical protein Poly51_12110 [Rubripirellula tenax]|uniref:General secretion pathway protein I n=1 Tax=Rubripirellula tenax TaxID=2528015 RepID=A0A5C6F9K5_9BACT|nr:hypothetical protein [Rubripirellula tenax]TWU58433.1 hypothetical protein Poly51_12110 [Rubripirellula tenax]